MVSIRTPAIPGNPGGSELQRPDAGTRGRRLARADDDLVTLRQIAADDFREHAVGETRVDRNGIWSSAPTEAPDLRAGGALRASDGLRRLGGMICGPEAQ